MIDTTISKVASIPYDCSICGRRDNMNVMGKIRNDRNNFKVSTKIE